MPTPFCPQNVPIAIQAQKEKNQEPIMDRARNDVTDSSVLKRWKYKGEVSPTKNLNLTRRAKTMPTPAELDEVDYSLPDCDVDNYEEGTMKARKVGDRDPRDVETRVLKTDPNACLPEYCDVQFGTGFRITKPFDLEKAYRSEVLCAEKLYKYGRKHLYDYDNMVRKGMAEFGEYNYKMNLLNEVVRRGHANSSVVSANMGRDIVSKYKWIAPPQGFLSITHLKKLYAHLMSVGAAKNGRIELEGPMEDFIQAIQFYEKKKFGDGHVCIQREPYMNKEGELRMREYLDYEQIRYYRNEKPRKAIWVGTGSTAKLKYIYPYIDSEELADAGVMPDDNPDYYQEWIKYNGEWHRLLTLYDMIPEDAASRWGLEAPLNPHAKTLGTALQLRVVTGAHIDCNEKETMWRYILQARARHRVDNPEGLGSIIAWSRPIDGGCGFLDNSGSPRPDKVCARPLTPERFRACSNSDCSTEGCGGCGDEASAEEAIPVVASLEPRPKKEILFDGEATEGAFVVALDGCLKEDSEIQYEFTDDTAVFGTNYTHTPEGETEPANAGTIQLCAGCQSEILIPFSVLGIDEGSDPLKATLKLTGATGGIELDEEGLEACLLIVDNQEDCPEPECTPDPEEGCSDPAPVEDAVPAEDPAPVEDPAPTEDPAP